MSTKKLSAVYVSWPRPDFTTVVKTAKNYRLNFHMALTYAHYELSSSELKKEVAKYLRVIDAKHPLLDQIKDIHENRFLTIGKYTYIVNHGGELPEDIAPKVIPTLEKILNEEKAKEASVLKEQEILGSPIINSKEITQSSKVVITIQDRLREKAKEAAGEVEGWLDDFTMDKSIPAKTVEEFVNLFKAAELKSQHMRYIQSSFEKRKLEIEETIGGKNKDLNEAYSQYSKSELKKLGLFYQHLFKACGMFQEVAKVERAPRKKKPVSHDKIISKLKFKKDDKALGVVSISPTQILGAKELWVYNTKTRKMAQYKAADVDGLSVKGTGLLNFSQESAEKTIRKPAEALAEFKKASKVKLRTFLKDLSTVDVVPNGKLNEHHLILRADK